MMSEIPVYDVVCTLIGAIDPVGETTADNVRIENLKRTIGVIESLIADIHAVARNAERQEFSMKRAGECAQTFLTEMAKEITRMPSSKYSADIRELIADLDIGCKILEGPEFDEAIVGTVERSGTDDFILYDYGKVIEILMETQGFTFREAVEWQDFNMATTGPGSYGFLRRLE